MRTVLAIALAGMLSSCSLAAPGRGSAHPSVPLAGAPAPPLELGGALATQSGPSDSPGEDRKIFARPYAWAPRISGPVTTDGSTTRLDIGIDTVVKNLELALMGQLEARKGETFVLLATLYSEIMDDPGLPSPGASLGITARMALAELDTSVHLVEQEGLQVDALIGLRTGTKGWTRKASVGRSPRSPAANSGSMASSACAPSPNCTNSGS
jgi:hypothetical protein